MSRSQRASAAAAAKRIAVQADHDEAADYIHSGGEKRTAKAIATLPRRPAAKRKRDSASPEYEDVEDENENEDEDNEDVDDDDNDSEAEAMQRKNRIPVSKRLTVGTPVVKKAKKARRATNTNDTFPLEQRLFSRAGRPATGNGVVPPACCPPERRHTVDYHRPLLLDGADGRRARDALLAWYDRVSAARGMPWRRPWVDPTAGLGGDDAQARTALARRAYEVWISEIMAQQTRIAVVIGYWTRWMARWPTMAALAAASADDVLQAWSGLGYYSRASRVHEAARLVAADPVLRGLLPPDVATLASRIPGVGRYTAGAVSAIVYGRAAPMVDGNVMRVLSRQLGVFADSKADKALVDLLWAAAEALVQAVARDGPTEGGDAAGATDDEEQLQLQPAVSDRPGRWGQALMELGSTVCAPKPDCAACPIRSTCRAYAEGLVLHARNTTGTVPPPLVTTENGNGPGDDDVCDLCEQFPELDEEEAAALARADKNKDTKPDDKVTTSPFFDVEDAAAGVKKLSREALATVVSHARTFPLRRPKKPVREVETLVCAVRLKTLQNKGHGLYLLHQRPAKGLLASLWQLPSHDLPAALDGKAARRKAAEAFVTRWLTDGEEDGRSKAKNGTSRGGTCAAATAPLRITQATELGTVPWLFSHLRQTMHVYLFDVAPEDRGSINRSNLPTPASCCWATAAEAEKKYSMGTGMRKCWALVREAVE
ncbi:A/G-specific adenine glycosylase [Sporothrix brasiliensis 5110]|uniref:Adenine DNA glycosylase n=1 Tax=Sporothrix brasiliensis 5110 TaxID=1398154 RepID=A0A0C2F615_9PEZI|nr:A/G-specific adenine glycosylase [Sporothrix brasiliensis 5110]KIH86463.1 A/G-specific adenine glycosylase [Sporothrix brasiliensis 5110]